MDSTIIYSRTKSPNTTVALIWCVLAAMEIVLVSHLLFILGGVRPNTSLTKAIYTLGYPLAYPFLRLLQISTLNQNILERATAIAMLLYWLIGWGLTELVFANRLVTPARKIAMRPHH